MPVLERTAALPAISAELESILSDMTAACTDLNTAVAQHREALRSADGPGAAAAAKSEQIALERLSGIDLRRRTLAARVGARHGAPSPTLTQMALTLPEPHKTRLARQAAALRALMTRTERESSTVRAATASLLAHMEGLMRQVGRSLSHAGTYGRAGKVEPVGGMAAALDVRS